MSEQPAPPVEATPSPPPTEAPASQQPSGEQQPTNLNTNTESTLADVEHQVDSGNFDPDEEFRRLAGDGTNNINNSDTMGKAPVEDDQQRSTAEQQATEQRHQELMNMKTDQLKELADKGDKDAEAVLKNINGPTAEGSSAQTAQTNTAAEQQATPPDAGTTPDAGSEGQQSAAQPDAEESAAPDDSTTPPEVPPPSTPDTGMDGQKTTGQPDGDTARTSSEAPAQPPDAPRRPKHWMDDYDDEGSGTPDTNRPLERNEALDRGSESAESDETLDDRQAESALKVHDIFQRLEGRDKNFKSDSPEAKALAKDLMNSPEAADKVINLLDTTEQQAREMADKLGEALGREFDAEALADAMFAQISEQYRAQLEGDQARDAGDPSKAEDVKKRNRLLRILMTLTAFALKTVGTTMKYSGGVALEMSKKVAETPR